MFWFRHMFLFSAEDAAAVQDLVVQLLSDKKLEVQELAARTLSGLIQVCQNLLPCNSRSKIPAQQVSAHSEGHVPLDRSVPLF